MPPSHYRTRIAPTPTGYLHLGHGRTFVTTAERARQHGGSIVLRMEDLDPARCQSRFYDAALEDLRWLGVNWDEGPDVGGPHAPYTQSERMEIYRESFQALKDSGQIYPCYCSRKDILNAATAPHRGEDEWIYPGTCRPHGPTMTIDPRPHCWRFRVEDGEKWTFTDGGLGKVEFTAGVDFGDFVIWRRDDVPAYQLAVTVDDALMGITEVVRGSDLLVSTARQLALYRAFGWEPPRFYHCPLVLDENGDRLAKRNQSQSLRNLRALGETPGSLRKRWDQNLTRL